MHNLPWLLEPQADFIEKCATLTINAFDIDIILPLAKSALSINQSNRLYREIQKLQPESIDEIRRKSSVFKLGIVSNATIDLFIPSLFTAALRHGVFLEVVTADYGQIAQEALDFTSKINQAKPDAVLLALDHRAYPFTGNSLVKSGYGKGAKEGLDYLEEICGGFRKNSDAICITQTLVAPPFSVAGNLDLKLDGFLRRDISIFNMELVSTRGNGSDVLMDVNGLASQVGILDWFDERQWYMSKVPMANKFIPIYADHITRILGALRGKSKKCLVLDLDNTLWGGVVGDDGYENLKIGQGHPVGESYSAFQQYVKDLKDAGVILAVCSKNEKETALKAFQKHPDMILKDTDFAIFVANWEDKASNLRYIADSLNIGLDSLVFVDDNPAEREIVRQLVPDVSVPELPKDPSLYPRILSAAGYFESISLTKEDALRSKQYAENTERQIALGESSGLDDYLESLEMRISFAAFDGVGRKRITQLINKTNQFNLTTKRYTEDEVCAFEESEASITIQARLTDRFGDNGMIGVLIGIRERDTLVIDSWLMSCRVIKRRVEEAMCDRLFEEAVNNNIEKIVGIYLPTEKNKLVKEHYKNLGFKEVVVTPEKVVWELSVNEYFRKSPPIKIV